MGNDLEGKVILLAGGASGIGRECALAYAREGATIAILNRNFEEAEGAANELGNIGHRWTSSQTQTRFYFPRFIDGCILPVSGGAVLGYRR
jgi:NAD(P)-dependent dehydrogenase (short-subunit alcohol dehydrogenase family)